MSVLSAFAMAQCNKKMQRRAFADSLGKPGEAANIREAISKAVKQDEILVRNITTEYQIFCFCVFFHIR